MDALHERWRRTWALAGLRADDRLLDGLVASYAEPHRAYHTLHHIGECFAHLDAYPIAIDDRLAIELALWFHDAVYDTRAHDNEQKSAELARSALPAFDVTTLDRIEALILATRHDTVPDDPGEQMMADVDLAILGAPAERFEEYETQIRREYAWVDEVEYRGGRSKVLAGFAARERIYATPYFHDLLEERARSNIERSMARL